jgi:hypothetical protein
MIRNHLASLDRLQEGVMYFARYASALGQTFVEAGAHGPRNLPHAQTVGGNKHEETSE